MSFPLTDWLCTPSADNTADLLTWGISTGQLKSFELWRHGPQWFSSTFNWPKWTPTNIFEVIINEGNEFVLSSTDPVQENRTDILMLQGTVISIVYWSLLLTFTSSLIMYVSRNLYCLGHLLALSYLMHVDVCSLQYYTVVFLKSLLTYSRPLQHFPSVLT